MDKRGFTLLELLVVVIILGILAAVAIPRLASVMEKARGTEATNYMREVRSASATYNSAYGIWDTNLSNLGLETGSGVTWTDSTNSIAQLKYWQVAIGTGGLITATRGGSGAHSSETITLDDTGTWSGTYDYVPQS